MTDSAPPTLDPSHAAIVHVAVAGTLEESLASLPITRVTPSVLVLPASLRRTDQVAMALRTRLRSLGGTSHLGVPGTGLAAVAKAGTPKAWAATTIDPPDQPSSQVRLPAPIIAANTVIGVTDVDAVQGHGPFVLDVLSRYLHPVDRLRLLASPRRDDAVTDLNLALTGTVTHYLVATRRDRVSLALWTDDAIAAELMALALADEGSRYDHERTGPWEERIVQRATELDLGIRLPSDMVVRWTTAPADREADRLERLFARVGVVLS